MNEWQRDGSLVYRLGGPDNTNVDEINVTMVTGSRDLKKREDVAGKLVFLLNVIEQYIDPNDL